MRLRESILAGARAFVVAFISRCFSPRQRQWLAKHRARLINVYLFVHIVAYLAWQTIGPGATGPIGWVEASFIAQNIVLAGVVLWRRDHLALDAHPAHQAVALGAFFSGIAFIGQPATGGAAAYQASLAVTLSANLLGIVTLLNLGKSFGILIACRGVKTGGLYRLVRHPMYLSDILLRIGFAIGHFTMLSIVLALISIALYVCRALLEERFLSRQADYRAYMQAVRYRFIPGVF